MWNEWAETWPVLCVIGGDIMLLDDPLSAVDAHVGDHLFQQCILGYLASSTRVLVTHHSHLAAYADHIVILDNGAVTAQGSYSELIKHGATTIVLSPAFAWCAWILSGRLSMPSQALTCYWSLEYQQRDD